MPPRATACAECAKRGKKCRSLVACYLLLLSAWYDLFVMLAAVCVGWCLCVSACILRRKVVCLVCLLIDIGTEMKIEEEAEGTVA